MSRLFGYSGFATSSVAAAASADAQRASSKAGQAEIRVRELEESLGKTMLICESLWELLRDKTGLTQDDLYAKLQEVDLRDGLLDGKNKSRTQVCCKCHRATSQRHARCMYCGEPFEKTAFQL